MHLSEEFYKTLTTDQIEENIEFIDWALVPNHLISKKIKENFSCIPGLKANIWFNLLLRNLKTKILEEKYKHHIFFFYEDLCIMQYSNQTSELYCSYEYVWQVFYEKYGFDYFKTQRFIEKHVGRYFEFLKVNPSFDKHFYMRWIGKDFKQISIAYPHNRSTSMQIDYDFLGIRARTKMYFMEMIKYIFNNVKKVIHNRKKTDYLS